MEFSHISQAISYARATGDTQALTDYSKKRVSAVAKKLMPAIVNQTIHDDDIYFLLAYGSALLDVHLASMSEEERALIGAIKNGIQITVVRTEIPMPHGDGDCEEDECE